MAMENLPEVLLLKLNKVFRDGRLQVPCRGVGLLGEGESGGNTRLAGDQKSCTSCGVEEKGW